MSIEATCPGCGATYSLSDDLSGKKVRCQKCQETFPVATLEVLPGDVAPDTVRAAPGTRPPVARRAERFDDDVPEPPATKQGASPWVWILGSVGLLLLILLVVCAGIGYNVTH